MKVLTLPHTIRLPSPTVVLAALLFLVAGCDETLKPDTRVPFAPQSVRVSMGAQTVTYDVDTKLWSGELEGELGRHPGMSFEFVDYHGSPIRANEVWLHVVVANPSVATWVPATAGGFTGAFQGSARGEAEWTVRLMHGPVSTGSADLVTEPLEVHVH